MENMYTDCTQGSGHDRKRLVFKEWHKQVLMRPTKVSVSIFFIYQALLRVTLVTFSLKLSLLQLLLSCTLPPRKKSFILRSNLKITDKGNISWYTFRFLISGSDYSEGSTKWSQKQRPKTGLKASDLRQVSKQVTQDRSQSK